MLGDQRHVDCRLAALGEQVTSSVCRRYQTTESTPPGRPAGQNGNPRRTLIDATTTTHRSA